MKTPIENQEIEKPVIINHEKFGLSTTQAASIAESFGPATSEAEGLYKVYDVMINSEMTEELSQEAKVARIATGKAIKKIEDVHKSQKAYFWQGGKFVDAIKNSKIVPLEQIKEGFKKMEDHYYIMKLEEIEKTRIKRTGELAKYTTEIPEDVGTMRQKVYDNYFEGVLLIYKAKVESEIRVETERLKAEKAEVLHKERKKELLHYWTFVPLDLRVIDFSELTEDDWQKRLSDIIGKQKAHDAKQEAQRVENVLLKKQSDEKDLLAKIESDKRAEIETKRDDELRSYITFIRDYSKMVKLPEDEYQKELEDIKRGAKEHWEAERQKQIKQATIENDLENERIKQQAILGKERKEKQDLADALQAIKDAEEKRLGDELAEKEAELNKGDADKINDLIRDLEALMTKYTFKSRKNQAKYLGVIKLISKVIKYIEE